jgi:hypothetical protein
MGQVHCAWPKIKLIRMFGNSKYYNYLKLPRLDWASNSILARANMGQMEAMPVDISGEQVQRGSRQILKKIVR